MKFKLIKRDLVLSFLAGAAWTIVFWLAITHFRPEISLGALVVLCVLSALAIRAKEPSQLAFDLACWFLGIFISVIVEYASDFPHILLPEWNAGNGLGVIVLLPFFVLGGLVTILAAILASVISRK